MQISDVIEAHASSKDDWLSGRFCALPWFLSEIHANGDVFVCCPRYSDNHRIGNVFTDKPMEVWNSKQAKAFRSGILDGNFNMCHQKQCPYIAGRTLPSKSSREVLAYREIIDSGIIELTKGPKHVKLVHDDSCNLSCPSCRTSIIVAKKDRQKQLDRALNEFILPYMADCEVLDLSGDGDPFASKHYRDILTMTAETSPKLRISLHTNAVLADPYNWAELRLEGRVGAVHVSIDAATKETYEVVRRGGNWERLMQNLEFLSLKRRRNEITSLNLLFVVQRINYKEMASFVKLGKALSVDSVKFSLIYRWGRAQTLDEYAESQIWNSSHPLYTDFLATLRDPIFDDRIVGLGDVTPLREAFA